MKRSLSRRSFLHTTAASAGLLAMPGIVGRARAATGELNIMGSDAFVPEDIREAFTAETGVQINFKKTTDASQVFNLLAAEGEEKSTDMAILAGHRMFSYIAADVLEPLDESMLPGMANLNPIHSEAASQYIDGKRYGIPMLIGFNLLGSRVDVVDPVLAESWDSIFGDTYEGRATMRPGSALFAAMFQLGVQDVWLNYDGNAEPIEKMFVELRQYVLERKHILRKWYSTATEVQQLLLGNEVDVAQGLNQGIMPLVVEDPAFRRDIPVEGAMGWTMNYSIIKGSQNAEVAYQFIDKLLNTEGAAASMVRASGNISTFKDTSAGLTEEEVRAYAFSDELLGRLEWLDVKGANDTRYELLDKYGAGLVEA